jgi:tetratricopeptide (TPR) repeat protein
MQEDHRISKVSILIKQKRYAEAERMLKELVAADSTDVQCLALLAEVNLLQDRLDVARNIVSNAIGIAPDEPVLFYIKSRIAMEEEKYQDAEQDIRQALALEPGDADYVALLAHINVTRKQYQEGLDIANKALEIDAENLLALNTRSTALLKLNRSQESFNTIEGALREAPNNAYTHANYGWGLLEKGDRKKALEHFREALKSDPNFKYAQSGMVEALKASNPIYRLFLKYAFWMSNLTSKYQWFVIIGFYFGTKALRTLANANEALAPFLMPVIIVLTLVAFSTWVINPIGNLFLRFSKYGQFLLDKEEKMSSNFVAISFVLCVLGLAAYFALSDDRYLVVAAFGFAMMAPFGVMFSPSKYKLALLAYAVVMIIVGGLAILVTFITGELFNLLTVVFIFGFVAYQWIYNFVAIEVNKR